MPQAAETRIVAIRGVSQLLIRLRRPELAFHAGRSKLLPEATGDQIVCEKAQPIALAFERLVTFITATRWKCDPAPSAETDMKARERGDATTSGAAVGSGGASCTVGPASEMGSSSSGSRPLRSIRSTLKSRAAQSNKSRAT